MTSINWQTESDSKAFSHEGWTVRVWGPDFKGHRVEVSAPYSRRDGIDVEVFDNEVDFSGSSGGEGGHWGVSLPWKIIEALVEARREILGS